MMSILPVFSYTETQVRKFFNAHFGFQLVVHSANVEDLRIDGVGFGSNPAFLTAINNANSFPYLQGHFPVDPLTMHTVQMLNNQVTMDTCTRSFLIRHLPYYDEAFV